MRKGNGAAVDLEIARILETFGDGPYRDLASMPLDQALELVRVLRPRAAIDDPEVQREDRTIALDCGGEIPIRIYAPMKERSGLPILMHLHGGGWVMGAISQDDARCHRFVREAGCIVISVGYRLAPEHPFPAPLHDSLSAWQWTGDNALSLGGDPARCAISGSSAGGHIAAGVCLLSRARGLTMPVFQLLTYPVIDPRMQTRSYREFAMGRFLTAARMRWFWAQYAGDAVDCSDERLALIEAKAEGLPATHVIVAEQDVLRDEGLAYAAHLSEGGVRTSVSCYPGMVHGFISIAPDHPQSIAALEAGVAHLRDAFGSSVAP